MTDNPLFLDWPDATHTAACATALGRELQAGDVILLNGPVGAGKTHFARSLIQSLLSLPEDVPSPTFTLVQTYDTRSGPLWHTDLYRVATDSEIDELGLIEAFDEAICLVEWPDRLGPLRPENALSIEIALSGDARTAKLSWSDPKWAERTAGLGQFLDRTAFREAFLDRAGWGNASRTLVAGDASNRRYERLKMTAGQTAILMDAAPDMGEDVRPFIEITQHLRSAHLSAPDIFAQDEANGYLLIEDLGDDLFARVMAEEPSLQSPLYKASVDVLVELHRAPLPELPRYDADIMTERAALAFDWYQLGVLGAVDTQARAAFSSAFHALLRPLDAVTPVLIQRDYHAENLIWLPDRTGAQRVGLLDYQDAMLGHPAYDLMSIAQDARRDVSAKLAQMMTDRYLEATGQEPDAFAQAYAVLGVQRNLRILGVFARLSLAYGKPHYVDLIPRVWGHIETNMQHPALASVKPLIQAALPTPTAALLQKLRDQCATIQLH